MHEMVYHHSVGPFVVDAKKVAAGDGLAAGTTMGPLANAPRLAAMERFIAAVVQAGMMSISHHRLSLPEAACARVKEFRLRISR
jgi:succinate-semialdehyde dehydrogenase / glutarate-semialdehyde dehydrogenase